MCKRDTHQRRLLAAYTSRLLHRYISLPPGFIRPIAIRTLSNENVDVQDVKNGNREWIFSVFQCSDSPNSTVEGKRIRCVKQKRSIKSNSELPVAIHEVRDGQRSSYLTSLWCLTRKRSVSQGKDKERLYWLDSHFKSVFLFLFSLAFQWLFLFLLIFLYTVSIPFFPLFSLYIWIRINPN